MSDDWERRTKILNGRRITYLINTKTNTAVMEKSELVEQTEEDQDATNNHTNQQVATNGNIVHA